MGPANISLPASSAQSATGSTESVNTSNNGDHSAPPISVHTKSDVTYDSTRSDGNILGEEEVPSTPDEHNSSSKNSSYKGSVPPAPEDMFPLSQAQYDKLYRTFFGMRKQQLHTAQGQAADDYERKYDPDPIYQEASPAARIWRIYMDETAVFDADMIGEMRDALDVLLVFAGLFSAVLTTFVAQTSQQLSSDFSEMTANLLYESVQIQRALASGMSVDSVPSSRLSPDIPFSPDGTAVWVNALWFTSLSLSLVTALAAVLVKQWLRQYVTLPSGTVRERACVRHYRFMGFERWHVAAIVGALPVVIHVSVALFLAGLAVFLSSLQPAIAYTIAVISGMAYVLYAVSNILPLFSPTCPYRTPVGDFIHWIIHSGSGILGYLRLISLSRESAPATLKAAEMDAVRRNGELPARSVFWLYDMSSNPTVRSAVVQAIGGLPGRVGDICSKLVLKEVKDDLVAQLTDLDCIFGADPDEVNGDRIERLLRTVMRAEVRIGPYRSWLSHVDYKLHKWRIGLHSAPDAYTLASADICSRFLYSVVKLGKYGQSREELVVLPVFVWGRICERAAVTITMYRTSQKSGLSGSDLDDFLDCLSDSLATTSNIADETSSAMSLTDAMPLVPRQSLLFLTSIALITDQDNGLSQKLVDFMEARPTPHDERACLILYLILWHHNRAKAASKDDGFVSANSMQHLCRALGSTATPEAEALRNIASSIFEGLIPFCDTKKDGLHGSVFRGYVACSRPSYLDDLLLPHLTLLLRNYDSDDDIDLRKGLVECLLDNADFAYSAVGYFLSNSLDTSDYFGCFSCLGMSVVYTAYVSGILRGQTNASSDILSIPAIIHMILTLDMDGRSGQQLEGFLRDISRIRREEDTWKQCIASLESLREVSPFKMEWREELASILQAVRNQSNALKNRPHIYRFLGAAGRMARFRKGLPPKKATGRNGEEVNAMGSDRDEGPKEEV